LTKALTGTLGYAYIHQQRTASGVSGYLAGQRSWQQLMLTHPIHKRVAVSHRMRLEQRYFPCPVAEGNSLRSNGHVYAGRSRYFTRGVIPVDGGLNGFMKGYFAALQNEIFVNVSDPSPVNGKYFDQNSAYFALGYRFSKQFDTEIGYMNQYISGTNNNVTNNHILQCATYIKL
jgi:hypothetical protein